MSDVGSMRLALSMCPSLSPRSPTQSRLHLCRSTLPAENRFEDILKQERFEVTEGEKMEEALSGPE